MGIEFNSISIYRHLRYSSKVKRSDFGEIERLVYFPKIKWILILGNKCVKLSKTMGGLELLR